MSRVQPSLEPLGVCDISHRMSDNLQRRLGTLSTIVWICGRATSLIAIQSAWHTLCHKRLGRSVIGTFFTGTAAGFQVLFREPASEKDGVTLILFLCILRN